MEETNISYQQLKKIVSDFNKAIGTKNLASLKDLSAEKNQVLALARKEMPESEITSNIINTINAGIKSVNTGLDTIQSLITTYDDLKYEFWIGEDMSGNGPPRNLVSIFYTTQNSCLIIKFQTIVYNNQNFLFGKLSSYKHLPLMQRAIEWMGEDYNRFLTENIWTTQLPELLANGKSEQLIAYYKSIGFGNEKINFTAPVTDTSIKELESKLGRSIPVELLKWWKMESISSLRDSSYVGSLEIFSADRMESIIKDKGYKHVINSMGMAEVLEEFHSQDEFKNILGNEDYDQLNKKYMIVGYFTISDSDAYYIYADQTGGFGLIEYRHDFDGDSWHAEFSTLLTTSRANDNLISCIANFFTLSAYELWQNSVDE